MAQSQTYGQHVERTRTAKDMETIVGNSIATLLAIGSGTLGLVGLLTGFDMINVENPFETGALWLGSGIVAGLAANAFRREHHIMDQDEVRRSTSTTHTNP